MGPPPPSHATTRSCVHRTGCLWMSSIAAYGRGYRTISVSNMLYIPHRKLSKKPRDKSEQRHPFSSSHIKASIKQNDRDKTGLRKAASPYLQLKIRLLKPWSRHGLRPRPLAARPDPSTIRRLVRDGSGHAALCHSSGRSIGGLGSRGRLRGLQLASCGAKRRSRQGCPPREMPRSGGGRYPQSRGVHG